MTAYYFFSFFLFKLLADIPSLFTHLVPLPNHPTHEHTMDAKKPLKSALKKTAASASSASAQTSAKRKHTPSVSTKTAVGEGNKRVKGNNNDNKSKPNKAKGNNNNNKPKQQHQKQKKSVTVKTPNQNGKKGGPVTAKKGGPVTAGSAPVKKVAPKPKKVEVIPEGSTLEDFRVVAGTYENVLYGIDAYWNEVQC